MLRHTVHHFTASWNRLALKAMMLLLSPDPAVTDTVVVVVVVVVFVATFEGR